MFRLRSLSHLLILLAITAISAITSYHIRYVSDWTRLDQHSLSESSINVLGTLPEQIRITAYLADTHPVREQLKAFIGRYERHHGDIDFRFVDPSSSPELVRDNKIKEGEIVLGYKERDERVSKLNEQAFSSALARLARNEQRYIVFISGHGERSPSREANHDVSEVAAVLQSRGINVQEINLSQLNAIPDNASLVIVASPQLAYIKNEFRILAKFVSGGGNFLWLSDPEEPPEMDVLGNILGVEKLAGTIVDPASLAQNLDNPALLLNTQYADHPALAGFNLNSLFIYASAFSQHQDTDFTVTTLIQSNAKSWSETSPLEGNVGLDDHEDFPGPLPLALALEREVEGQQQRVAVFGDGDFIANAYRANGGNQDLAVRIVEWLISDDALIDVPSRAALDTELSLKTWQTAVIGFGFLFVLPGALLLNGIVVWNRRKRA